ncbi:uncharacterized protein TRIVIDRAFT_63890 [Trichoderma virens Gv29-8]|uniref:Uncharacterized protein n=1 Tax=Hypocrea virens (strain Gv29-8 / FGSC 10586) TaxID=413071 RepID=G9MP90_HYPVG|nr:uncharacterized protein TRIVIDRAFT_63890 [Trichoderma virens Gv29-8]EHK23692.1 hypothetical protein TRIVIDRAFT_63890 [Trichoderma virens Gv29-8]
MARRERRGVAIPQSSSNCLESIKSVETGIVTGRELLLAQAQESLAPALVRPRDSRPGYQVQDRAFVIRQRAKELQNEPRQRRAHTEALASVPLWVVGTGPAHVSSSRWSRASERDIDDVRAQVQLQSAGCCWGRHVHRCANSPQVTTVQERLDIAKSPCFRRCSRGDGIKSLHAKYMHLNRYPVPLTQPPSQHL